ncbi:MAG: DUF86 domain-containing protein [Caldilineaceae bacterium]|nr:DUF86 domain-containing protein [Caldilineaceae bacterium]
MSDVDREGRPWRFYVQDMIEFGEKVLVYTDGLDQEAFIADGLTYDATLRNLQLIGEAATHIPDEVRQSHPEVPWHAIIGTRNRLAHSYLAISDSIIWGVIQEAVPDLLPALRNLLESESGIGK